MKKYEKITRARELLGLPEQATRSEIKAAYRTLIKKYHPDRRPAAEEEKASRISGRITAAYRVLSAYCDEYRIPFTREEVEKYVGDDEWWFDRFGNDPLWGRNEGG